MLAEIKRAREAALTAESETKAARHRAEALNADLQYRLAKVEEARREVLAEARAQAQAELAGAAARGRRAARPTGRPPAERGAIQSGGKNLHEQWLAEAEIVVARREPPGAALALRACPEPDQDRWPAAARRQGVGVVAQRQRRGGGRGRQRRGGQGRRLSPAAGAEPGRVARARATAGRSVSFRTAKEPQPPSPGMELDLRGLTVDDMLIELDRYLDTAYLAGLPFVRIIHGKGTGALRQAVREELRGHPLVGEFRAGENSEGGEGVTVAKLVQR